MHSEQTENSICLDLERSFGSLSECVVICDADRIIFFVNRATERTFGYSRDVLIGQTSECLYADPRDYASTNQIREQSSSDGSGYEYSMLLRRKDARTFTAEVVSTPIYDDKGTHVGFLSIARDMTDRIALETMLHDASLTLEDAIEAISEGFALYDKNDCLVICNNNYRQLYAHSISAMTRGAPFAQILQYGLDRNEYDTKGQSKADWLQERLAKHEASDGTSFEQSLADGTWLQITEQKTRSGGRAGIRTDITALKNAQNDLKAANRDLSLLADNLSCAIIELDPKGTCVFINSVGAEWFGGRPSDFVGTAIRDYLPQNVREQTRAALKNALNGDKTYVESGFVYPDDVFRHTAVEYTPKRNEAGSVEGLIVFANDITERKKTEQTLAELYNITSTRDLSSDGKINRILELGCNHFDLDFGIISHVADEMYTISKAHSLNGEIEVGTRFPLGDTYCKHTLLANEPIAITHTARSSLASHPCYEIFKLESYIGAPLLVDGRRYGTINFTSKNPRKRAFSQTDRELIRQFADWAGHEIARQQDHEALIAAQVRLERIASVDDLTHTLNRRAFLEHASTEVARYRRTNNTFTAMILDIDHFKSINDTYGHSAGDDVLRLFAEIVKNALRSVDVFGRIGGEEFCIILDSTGIDGALVVAERIRTSVADCSRIASVASQITCSLGISEIDNSDVDFSSIFQRADKALYQAKESGRNRTVVYAQQLDTPADS